VMPTLDIKSGNSSKSVASINEMKAVDQVYYKVQVTCHLHYDSMHTCTKCSFMFAIGFDLSQSCSWFVLPIVTTLSVCAFHWPVCQQHLHLI
jgi:hypothetical protein